MPAAWLLLLLAVATRTSGSPLSEAVSCHVCGQAGSGDLFPGQPPPPECQLHDLPAPRRCPDHYRGCLTLYDGENIMRTCERQVFDSCKVVNQAVYCYCGGTLCNSQDLEQLRAELGATTTTTTTTSKCETSDAEVGDDEDEDGGSGDGDPSDPWRGREPSIRRRCGQVDRSPDDDVDSTTTTRSSTRTSTNADDLLFVGSSSEETTSTESGTHRTTSGSTSAPGSASGLQAFSALWLLAATCVALRI